MLDLSSAHSFTDVITFMRHARRRATQTFSYRQLADKLGYRSPRTLAMVHKGQRAPSRALVAKVIKHLSLSPVDAEFVMLLAERAVSTRKGLVSVELDQRIENIRALLVRIAKMRVEMRDLPLVGSVSLSEAQLLRVRDRLRVLFLELASEFTDKEGKTYRIAFDLCRELDAES